VSDDPTRTLIVGAELTLESDDARLDISTADGTLFVDCADLDSLVAAYRLRESVQATSERLVSAGVDAVEATNIAFSVPVVVRVDGVRVARYAPRGSVGPLGRLLGGRPVRSDPLGVARVAVRRLRAALRERR